MPELPGKFVRESISEYTEFALPVDANPLGNVLGGKVMHLVDLAGAMAAIRHAHRHVVTASIDYMTFLHPIPIGSLVILRSSVNRVFRSSWRWVCASKWRICARASASTRPRPMSRSSPSMKPASQCPSRP